jgi:hypothetical protein
MLNLISNLLVVLSLVGLIFGYIKKNRNIMLASAILLWFAGSLNDFVRGFIEGMNAVK